MIGITSLISRVPRVFPFLAVGARQRDLFPIVKRSFSQVQEPPEETALIKKEVFIPADRLKKGYRETYLALQSSIFKVYATALGCSTFSALWFFFDKQSLLGFPVPKVAAILGVLYMAKHLYNLNYLKKYTTLSLLCSKEGLTEERALDEHAFHIVHGGAWKWKLKLNKGIFIWGISSRVPLTDVPSPQTMEKIQALQKITIPRMALSSSAANHADALYVGWSTRRVNSIAYPVSVGLVVFIALKAIDGSRCLTFLDLVIFGVSTKNVSDILVNPVDIVLEHAQVHFREYLQQASTRQEILSLLIDPAFRQTVMKFMDHWKPEEATVGISLSRSDKVHLREEGHRTLFDPFPNTYFPALKSNGKSPM